MKCKCHAKKVSLFSWLFKIQLYDLMMALIMLLYDLSEWGWIEKFVFLDFREKYTDDPLILSAKQMEYRDN